ncbi:hypothetical protein ACGFYV_25110 [Streptomyces sp. NPDC048297]|uniref:hypothetical protein n=1 Tax=Streptomyces sp. NPDC048297 TaxID=3365531 RepID=UPI003720E4ED
MLVAAFSAVVAVGTLAGLSGAKSDTHKASADHSVTAASAATTVPLDTRWDAAPLDTRWDVAPLDTRWD